LSFSQKTMEPSKKWIFSPRVLQTSAAWERCYIFLSVQSKCNNAALVTLPRALPSL
jgi:hypothetical protein